MELGMFPIGVISVLSFFFEMSPWWKPLQNGDWELRQTVKAGKPSLDIEVNKEHLQCFSFLSSPCYMCKLHF